jgi:hypothetical protein
MRPEDIRAFVERPRAEVELLKREHWAKIARSAAEQGVPLGHLLHAHARVIDPSFPNESYSREDWEHQLRLKELVDRAAAAFVRR